MNIDEMIADARAEEELTKEQAQEQFTTNVYNAFNKAIKDDGNKVTFPLTEYTALKYADRDLTIILGAIIEDMKLGYKNEDLVITSCGENIINAVKLLYRPLYDAVYAAKLEEET